MKPDNLGGARSIRDFVNTKLARFEASSHSFEALFPLMFSERENILLEKSAGYRIEKTSYGEACDQILRRTVTLRNLLSGTPQDAVVGLAMENSLLWIESFWCILRAGFCPLLLNLRLDDETLQDALDQSGAAAVISEGRSFDTRTIPVGELVEAQTPDPDGRPFGSCFYVMSSGTSGSVKLCAYTAEQVWQQLRDSGSIIRRCRAIKKHYRGQLKLLTFLPFYHIFGLTAVYFWFSFFSRTFVLLNDFAPQTVVNTIRRHEVTHIFAVPLFWEKVRSEALRTIRGRGEQTSRRFERGLRLSNRLGSSLLGRLFRRFALREVRDNLFGDSIRFIISGGSELRPEIAAFFNGVGYRLANGYGMSEIGIASVELSARFRWLNRSFVGKPLPSFSFTLGADGALSVTSPASAAWILEGGARTEGGGSFETKDLAEQRSGRYRILGRSDELVVSPSGENLNPNRIEPKLALPGVRDVCLIGDRRGGKVLPVLLCFVPSGITAERLTELRREAAARISALDLSAEIGKVEFVAGERMLPTEFKPSRGRIAADYAAGRLPVCTAETLEQTRLKVSDEDLLRSLRVYFAAALDKKPGEIADTADFFLDLGGTSLDYLALVSKLETDYSVSFPKQEGASPASVKDFYTYLEASGHGR